MTTLNILSILSSPASLIALIVEVPGISHHKLKVLIIIDGGADIVVILNKLLEGNLRVSFARVFQRMMKLESIQELGQHLVLGLFTRAHLRVCLGVVETLNIIEVNDAVAISIEFIEGALHQGFSVVIHFTDDASHELIIRDYAIPIQIEQVEQFTGLFSGNLDAEVAYGFPELGALEVPALIIIHDSEYALHSEYASGASHGQLASEQLNHIFISVLRHS